MITPTMTAAVPVPLPLPSTGNYNIINKASGYYFSSKGGKGWAKVETTKPAGELNDTFVSFFYVLYDLSKISD